MLTHAGHTDYIALIAATLAVQSIIDSALNPVWGNTAMNVVTIGVPTGTTYYQGVAAPQGGLVGGGNQVLFPLGFMIDPSWIR